MTSTTSLFDCPPNLGILTVNALVAATEIYIPWLNRVFGSKRTGETGGAVEIVKRRLNRGVKLTGIIGTRYDKRKCFNREVVEKIHEYFGDKVFKTLIRDNIALAEAPSHNQDIFDYSPRSYSAADCWTLCREIIQRR